MTQSITALSQIKEAANISKEDASTSAELTIEANQIAQNVKKSIDSIKEQIAKIQENFEKSSESIKLAGTESRNNLQHTEDVLQEAKLMRRSIKHLKKILRKIELTIVQTASLSINGSVEAMQVRNDAENYSEGFLTVSNDIRNLAQNSEESLDKVNDIVDNLEDETESIIEALSIMKTQGIAEANDIIVLSSEMKENTAEIDQNTQTFKEVSIKLDEISHALEEAKVGAEQTLTAADLALSNAQESEVAAHHIQSISNTMTDNVSELIEITAMMKDE